MVTQEWVRHVIIMSRVVILTVMGVRANFKIITTMQRREVKCYIETYFYCVCDGVTLINCQYDYHRHISSNYYIYVMM